MSFPVSPTNGQTSVVNGITYSYSTATSSWTRIAGQVTATTYLIVTNTTSSTNTTTGALTVAGGAGFGGSVNIGGTVVGGGVRSTTSATPPSNPTVGDIWYNSSTDIIYRYTDTGSGSYVWLDLNGPSTGPSGPQGPQGVAGAQGPQGVTGPQGPSGSNGSAGAQGPQGVTGPQGPQGVAGAQGPQGVVGAQGPQGVAGAQGPQGPGSPLATQFTITNTTAASSTITGALQVAGGVGIGGGLVVGGIITATNISIGGYAVSTASSLTIQSAGVSQGTAATINFSTGLTATVATNVATITVNTATLQVGYAANILGNGAGNGALLYQSAPNTTGFLGQGSAGWLLVSQGSGSAPAFSSTANIYVNSSVKANNIIGGTTDQIPYQSATDNTTFSSGLTFNGTTFTATNVSIPGTTSSTNTITGALTVAGGVGIGGSLYVGGEIIAQKLTIEYTTVTTTLVKTDDIIQTANNTASSSTTTGAVIVTGGMGVGGNVNIGGTVVGGGIRTSTTSTAPNNPTVGDIWYYPITDTIYRYTDDGSGSYIWIDTTGPGSGSMGPQGPSGPSGPGGNTGPTGPSGGPTGPTGPSGPGNLNSGIAGYVPYYSAATTLSAPTSGNLYWDNTNARLAIGNSSPAQALHVTGQILATNTITAFYSDDRLKNISGTIADALNKVNQLRGVYYTNNKLAGLYGYTSQEQQVGVLARDVETVLPEIVKAAPFDLDVNNQSKSGENYKTVQYERLVPLLIEAIKELNSTVKNLQAEIEVMKHGT